MHDNRSHPLLEQVPLTVSPFVQLPRATTLPYRYKTMPSALPPSIIEGGGGGGGPQDLPRAGGGSKKTPFVVSPANSLAAHPDDILASCQTLLAHLDRMQADAEAELQALDARIKERELAEKRRLAPGWLDSDARLLIPERSSSSSKDTPGSSSGSGSGSGGESSSAAHADAHSSTFELSEMSAALPEGATASGGAPAGDAIGGFSAEALNQAFGSGSGNGSSGKQT